MILSERQQEERQRKAFENRESIQPRDLFSMKCIGADEECCYFKLKSGDTLCCSQPYDKLHVRPLEPVKENEWVEMYCSAIMVKANGYGRFVDYQFYSNRLNHHVVINGPDAQALERVSSYAWE